MNANSNLTQCQILVEQNAFQIVIIYYEEELVDG